MVQKFFPKIYEPSQNSRRQKDDKNEVPYEDLAP